MKKIVLFLLALLLPCLVVNAETCSKEIISELREKARSVDFNIEYKKSLEVDQTDRYFEISSPNLSDDLFVTLQGEPYISYMITRDTNVSLKGGVYTVEFVSISCEETVYSYNMMIPYFSEENSDVWFDGTYEKEEENTINNRPTSKKENFVPIAVGIFALALIVIISTVLIKKRRKIK